MIQLASTNDLIQVNTASSTAVKVYASWVDNNAGTITAGRTNTASITGTGDTTVVAAPGASTARRVKYLSVRNDHASLSNLVILKHTDGTNAEPLWQGTLLAGETAVYAEGSGWQYLDANGAPKLATPKLNAVVTVTGSNVVNATTSFADVTGLTVAVKNGKKYVFEAYLFYITNATTTGAQFGVNGSFTSLVLGGVRVVTNSVTGAALSSGVVTAADTADAAQTTGPAVNAPGNIYGEFVASADSTFAIRSKSEVAVANGLTILIGSWLRVQEADA